MDIIRLRPHHFRTFFDRDYGFLKIKQTEPKLGREESEKIVIASLKEMTPNLKESVTDELCSRLWHNNPDTLVMIVPGPRDDICDRCDSRYRANSGCVRKESWNSWLGLEVGVSYTIEEVLKRLEDDCKDNSGNPSLSMRTQ